MCPSSVCVPTPRGSMCKCVCATRVHGNALRILPCYVFAASSPSAEVLSLLVPDCWSDCTLLPRGSWPDFPKLTTASDCCTLLKAQPVFLPQLTRALPLRISRRRGYREGIPFYPPPLTCGGRTTFSGLLLLDPLLSDFSTSVWTAPGLHLRSLCFFPCQLWEPGLRVSNPWPQPSPPAPWPSQLLTSFRTQFQILLPASQHTHHTGVFCVR